ncbi:MAG TPA: OmpA family protein [Cyclobacteriaceae bacterium]|nr:OmpA family protein [Cyclobacteriaceae bacterium]
MNTKNIGALILCLFMALSPGKEASAFNSGNYNNVQSTNYIVVIGAFAIKRNAERFTKRAIQQKYQAKFQFNPDRNLYYVFTLTTSEKESAMNEAKRLREETAYTDAWVYQGAIGETTDAERKDINPVTEQPMVQIPITVEETPEPEKKEEPAVTEEKKPEPPATEAKKFFFKSYRSTDNKVVNAEVDAVDVDRTRKIATYKSNEIVYLESPKSTSGKVTLIANIFGYRKAQVDINYNAPEGEGITIDSAQGVVVPFELIRLRKGDIVVLYNVFFFKDAAVMMPESKYEVDNLLEMMTENPKCKIRLHGHTNGNATGKIISMGESKNFFSLTGSKEGLGSAKALSQARATVIRDYLVDNGIDVNRMEVKPWGGKRALYDKESTKAKENVRVEVEIIED